MKFKEWLQTLPVEQLDEFAATAAATSPIWAPAVKAGAVTAGAYVLSKTPQIYSSIKNMMSKKHDPSDKVNYPKKPEKPTPKEGESWDSGKRYVRNGKPVPTRNLSGRYKTYKRDQQKRKDFQDKLTSSSPYDDYNKQPKDTTKPGRNEKAIEKIRADLKKLNDKNKNK